MISENLERLKAELPADVLLVAVSKFHTSDEIMEAYNVGHRHFGESRQQELAQKYPELPKDIKWHFIGPLQTNKVRAIMPMVSLFHSVDRMRLARVINSEAKSIGMVVDVLLQVHIADETTKQGFQLDEIEQIMNSSEIAEMDGINVVGLMGMATFTENHEQVSAEFSRLSEIYNKYDYLKVLSIGMSQDYKIAIECGSNMVRIGSLIFGERE